MRNFPCSVLVACGVLFISGVLSNSDEISHKRILEDDCNDDIEMISVDPLSNGELPAVVRFTLFSEDDLYERCNVKYFIDAPEGFRLLITFDEFKLAARTKSGVCVNQTLQITLGPNHAPTYCDTLDKKLTDQLILSDDSETQIHYFRSRQAVVDDSFKLRFNVAPVLMLNDENSTCPEVHGNFSETVGYFKCDSMCIPLALKCDGSFHCADKTDEVGCESNTEEDEQESTTGAPVAKTGGNKILIFSILGGLLLIALVTLVAVGVFRHKRVKGEEYTLPTTTTRMAGTPNNSDHASYNPGRSSFESVHTHQSGPSAMGGKGSESIGMQHAPARLDATSDSTGNDDQTTDDGGMD